MTPALGAEGYVLVHRAIGKGARSELVGAARVRVVALAPLSVEVIAGSEVPAGRRLLVEPAVRRPDGWFASVLYDARAFRAVAERYWGTR